MTNEESKQIILSVISIAILIIAFVGVSYAAVNTFLDDKSEINISTGIITLSLENDTNVISFSDSMPVSDSVGKNLTNDGNVYDFSVKTVLSKNTTVNYEISAEKLPVSGVELSNEFIRLYLQKKDNSEYIDTNITANPQPFIPSDVMSFLGSKTGSMILYNGTFSNNTNHSMELTDSFRLRVWVSNDFIIDSISRSFKLKLNVVAKAV